MYAKILLSLSISIQLIDSLYLEAEANYLKPKLERNNIVNKGVWVRNNLKDRELFEKTNLGNFIFRPNSVDRDNILQNNFDAFGETALQDPPFVSSYVQRTRRSPELMRKRRPRKSMKIPKVIKASIEDSVMIKSKIVSNLKPSVLNEYPYEVAILLNNDPHKIKDITPLEQHEKTLNVTKFERKSTNNTYVINKEEIEVVTVNPNATKLTDVPKRSKKYDHETGEVNNYNMIDDYNTTDAVPDNGVAREFFTKDERFWNQNSPLPDRNVYKVIPKEAERIKSISENGLIKVISMLTKTFKKITKQQKEVKNIYHKLTNGNKNFELKEANLISKFEDFDSKYSDMIQFNDKMKGLEAQIDSQKHYFEVKEKEIQNTFLEFQNQQKKFLGQQRQFYAIQKLMLAQNEKINAKQNLIAKTQSEISHRQNNLARILKKAKEIINDSNTRVSYSQVKKDDKYTDRYENTVIPITTPTAANTESMKINLFSIPTKNTLQNQDALIIKEKDDKQIDDLVYKFYFNNTFIDSLMKSKILNNYDSNNVDIASRRSQPKNKRDELETTILLPINNNRIKTGKRERRWINHFSKNKYRRLNRHRKEITDIITERNKVLDDTRRVSKVRADQTLNVVKEENSVKSDPFTVMAMTFCNEIGQNTNDQVLKWCIEKALRRLQIMEMNVFTPPPSLTVVENRPTPLVATKPMDEITTEPEELAVLPSTVRQSATSPAPMVTSLFLMSTPAAEQGIFFPDNDELESNLKQYDLKPDTEGNVYYEGSVHISDFGRMLPNTDSEGTSDIMPGLVDSNSRVEIDPLAFDIQARRRANVRRINERIMKQMTQRH